MNIQASMCRLRALEMEDLEVMYRWENDTELWRVSGTTAPFSRHSLMRLIEEQQYDIYASRQQRLVIETDIDNLPVVVGAIDLFDFDPQNLRAGVGVVVSAEHRERGYAKDALNILERYATQVLHLHQLWCGIGADNKASIRLFQGAGFVECGRRREWILTADGAIDEILMQKILR